MKQLFAAIVIVLCSPACAYHAPDAPTPILPIADSVPMTLSLGSHVDAGRVLVTAKVQNVHGTPLSGVMVQFATEAGSFDPASLSTGGDGQASTVLTASSAAAVTATAGALTAHTLIQPAPITVPLPTPPSSAPIPQPGPSNGPLSVSLTAGDVILGTQTIFAANVKGGPAVGFVWNFGDGSSFNGTSATTAHTYGSVGSGLAQVTVTDATGQRASATAPFSVNPVPPPPPPAAAPTPGLTATLTASSRTVVTGGTLTFTAAVTNLGSDTISAYQWDLDGDGKFESTTTAATRTSVAYTTAGLFTAHMQATTSTGRTVSGSVGFVVTN